MNRLAMTVLMALALAGSCAAEEAWWQVMATARQSFSLPTGAYFVHLRADVCPSASYTAGQRCGREANTLQFLWDLMREEIIRQQDLEKNLPPDTLLDGSLLRDRHERLVELTREFLTRWREARRSLG